MRRPVGRCPAKRASSARPRFHRHRHPLPRVPPRAPRPRAGVRADARQLALFGALEQRDGHAEQLGDLASKRGASDRVRQLGKRIGEDHRNLGKQLEQLMKERGVDRRSVKMPAERQPEQDALVRRLSSLKGADFDRQFVDAMEPFELSSEQELKQMRDQTPGADARLKGWLDAVENVEESHVTAVRQVRDALGAAERAARRPPIVPAPRGR